MTNMVPEDELEQPSIEDLRQWGKQFVTTESWSRCLTCYGGFVYACFSGAGKFVVQQMDAGDVADLIVDLEVYHKKLE